MEALAVERRHGERSPEFIAERIGALAAAGDVAGVKRWQQIAVQFDRLNQPAGLLS